MTRFARMLLVGLVLTVGTIAGACSPTGPSTVPIPSSGTAVPQVSPTATTTPSPADIEATLTRVAQYDQQLKQMAAGNPSLDDLVNTLQEVLTLSDYVTTYYPRMSAQQRSQALGGLMGILGDETSVVNTHARVFPATATAFAVAHPTVTPGPGTPTALPQAPQGTLGPAPQAATATVSGTGTPTGNPVARQINADLDAIISRTVVLASDLPSDQDIVSLLQRLQAVLNQLSQQSAGMSDADVQSVLKEMDRAIANLVPVVQTHTGQESSAIATPTPLPTATLPATPGPAPAGTPTPGS